jgi:hypothetical protein
LEQENQDLRRILSEKDEETSCLKNLNQILLEQIRMLKEEEAEKEGKNKANKSDKEENSGLKVHNQTLLTQIKKLKETMNEPMELEKSLDVKSPIVDKRINTNPVNLRMQIQLM